MAFKLDGKILPTDVAFTSNGINYPANWLRLTTLDEKKAIGITEVSDAPTYDQRFYWGVDKPKALDTLKASYIQEQKIGANRQLSKYDWYYTRKYEHGTAVPDKIIRYRKEVRDACTTREGQITTTSSVDALKTIVDTKLVAWPEDPN